MLLLAHRHAVPPALWSSIPREIKIPPFNINGSPTAKSSNSDRSFRLVYLDQAWRHRHVPRYAILPRVSSDAFRSICICANFTPILPLGFPPIHQAAWRNNVSLRSPAMWAAVRAYRQSSIIIAEIVRITESHDCTQSNCSASEPASSDMRSHLYYTSDHKVPRRELGTAIRVARSFGFTIFPRRTESDLSECQNDNRDQPRERKQKNTHFTRWSARDWTGWWGTSESRVKWGRRYDRSTHARSTHALAARRLASFSRPSIQDVSFSLYFRHVREMSSSSCETSHVLSKMYKTNKYRHIWLHANNRKTKVDY